jgi:hypothetical protein
VAFPKPVAALVIRYAYLWRREAQAGREEGAKDRPSAIILATPVADDEQRVFVRPITHTAPADLEDAIEVPHATKVRLGLDDKPSYVVLTEANDFVWPGPDLRPAHPDGDPTDVAFGFLPKALFDEIKPVCRQAQSEPCESH